MASLVRRVDPSGAPYSRYIIQLVRSVCTYAGLTAYSIFPSFGRCLGVLSGKFLWCSSSGVSTSGNTRGLRYYGCLLLLSAVLGLVLCVF